MSVIGIIPARSGSKGLKNKNVKELCGKPLLAYSIEAAKESGVFDEIMVSTDSEEYANIARNYGANVPFLRGKENSTDKASSWDVVKEVLSEYEKIGKDYDTIFLLQPTSPLRTANSIKLAYELFLKKNANFVIGVTETDHSPIWCNELPEDFSMKHFINKEYAGKPRQQLPKYYRINGAIYIIGKNYLYNNLASDFLNDNAFAFVMDKKESIDIDDELDFKIAEVLVKDRINKQ